jgi:hypothetical protein
MTEDSRLWTAFQGSLFARRTTRVALQRTPEIVRNLQNALDAIDSVSIDTLADTRRRNEDGKVLTKHLDRRVADAAPISAELPSAKWESTQPQWIAEPKGVVHHVGVGVGILLGDSQWVDPAVPPGLRLIPSVTETPAASAGVASPFP